MSPLQIVGLSAEIVAVALVGILLDRWLGDVAAVVGLLICLTFLGWFHREQLRSVFAKKYPAVTVTKPELTPSAKATPPTTPQPPTTSKPHPPDLMRVSRYDLVPYKVGDPLKIRMFVDNKGASTITLIGGTHSKLVDKLPSNYKERRQLENKIWAETDHYSIAKDRPLKFLRMPLYAELTSEDVLDQTTIDKLQNGSIIYLMSIFKNQQGKVVIESCIHTDPLGNSAVLCVDHNSP